MSLTDTSGIVLRMSDWSETSAIVTWFTRDFGKLRTVAKGAHRPKSPFRGKLDLFYLDDLVFLPSRRGELHTLHECFVENAFPRIRERLDLFTAAGYCCDFVDVATEPEGPVPPLFELLVESLAALDAARDSVAGHQNRSRHGVAGCSLFIPRFELRALDCLGFRPPVAKLDLDAGARRAVEDLLSEDCDTNRLRLSPAQARQIDTVLAGFIARHLGRLPKSRHLLARRAYSDIPAKSRATASIPTVTRASAS